MYRLLESHPKNINYIRLAKFEQKNKRIEEARKVFEKGIQELSDNEINEEYFVQFAKFESRNKEIERTREIFKYGLQKL